MGEVGHGRWEDRLFCCWEWLRLWRAVSLPANKQTSWGMPQQKVNEPWSATGATAKVASCKFLSAPAPSLRPPDLGSKPIGSAQSKRLQAVATRLQAVATPYPKHVKPFLLLFILLHDFNRLRILLPKPLESSNKKRSKGQTLSTARRATQPCNITMTQAQRRCESHPF